MQEKNLLLLCDTIRAVGSVVHTDRRELGISAVSTLSDGLLTRNIQQDVKQRKRNAQDRKEEEIEDGTEEVNKEVNRNRKGRRKGVEQLRRQGNIRK